MIPALILILILDPSLTQHINKDSHINSHQNINNKQKAEDAQALEGYHHDI